MCQAAFLGSLSDTFNWFSEDFNPEDPADHIQAAKVLRPHVTLSGWDLLEDMLSTEPVNRATCPGWGRVGWVTVAARASEVDRAFAGTHRHGFGRTTL